MGFLPKRRLDDAAASLQLRVVSKIHYTPSSAQTWVKSDSGDPRLLVVLQLLASGEHCAKQGDEKESTAGSSNGLVKNPARLQVSDGIVYIKPDAGPDRHVSTAVAQFDRTS